MEKITTEKEALAAVTKNGSTTPYVPKKLTYVPDAILTSAKVLAAAKAQPYRELCYVPADLRASIKAKIK